MAIKISDPTYAQKVASLGGSWDATGATQNTWGTEAVDPTAWQSGGWYTNPTTGYVEKWNSGTQASSATTSATPSTTSTGTSTVSLASRPTINLQETYSNLYSSLGLESYKEEVAAKQQELLALRSATDDAVAMINENPWGSEATRTGRVSKLESQYNSKASVLTAEAALVQQKYTDAMSELNTQLSLQTQQYQYDTAAFDSNLAQLNTLLDMGALDNASIESLSSIGEQVGLSAEMIQSMVNAQKAKNVSPSLISNTDDSGNVTLTLVDTNTGNIINQTSLGTVSGTSKSSGTSATQEKADTLAYLDDAIQGLSQANLEWAQQQGWETKGYSYIWPDQWKEAFFDWQAQTGGSYSEFKNRYSRYIDPNQAEEYDLGV